MRTRPGNNRCRPSSIGTRSYSLVAVLPLLVSIVCGTTAYADGTSYSTFGPGGTYDTVNHWAVKALPPNSGSSIIAAPFMVTQSTSLLTADVAFAYSDGTNTGFTATILADSNGAPNDNLALDSSHLSTIGAANIYEFGFYKNAILTANTQYWLVMAPDNLLGDERGFWYWNNQGTLGVAAAQNFILPWTVYSLATPAFSINRNYTSSATAPEASSLALTFVSLGFLTLSGTGLHRRFRPN